MATTFTTNKAIGEPANGDTGWGTTVNTSLSQIDTAFGGSTSLNVTSLSGNQTLSSAQYSPLTLNISGTLTANVTYVVPSGVGGQWMVYNGTTGAFTLAISSAAGGSAVTIPQGGFLNVSCDGSASGMRTTQSVSSVALSTTLSGIAVGGSPITSAGTLTLSGTLGAASGGTGLTSFTSGGAIYATGTATLASGTLPVASGGTGVTTSTGTGSNVLSNSPTLSTPALGTPSAAVLTNATGLPLTTGVTGTLPVGSGGTGITSLTSGGAVYATGTATLTSGTLPVASGGTGVTSSTGTGSVVLSNSPTLTTPSLGTPSAAVLTNATGLPLTTGVTGTLAITKGGTGLTTTPSAGQIIIGNGTSYLLGSINGTNGVYANYNSTYNLIELFLSNTTNTIGTYIFAICSSSVTYGATVSGSTLSPSSSANNAGSGTLSGSWRCMGAAAANVATLFIRIS